MKGIGVNRGAGGRAEGGFRQRARSREIDPVTFRLIEADVSRLEYRGVSIGGTLNDTLLIDLLWGYGERGRRATWRNRVLILRYLLAPRRGAGTCRKLERGKILVTWAYSTPRLDDLLLPVVDEIGHDRCQVMMGSGNAIPGLPPEVPCMNWNEVSDFTPSDWRREYRLHRKTWRRVLKDVCRRYRLPRGAYALLSLNLLVASQRIEGFLGFLSEAQPSLVLTEKDRSQLWSCLILAAKRLGISTMTLVHGVIPPDALGSSPILADLVMCWGESDRQKFLSSGESSERVIIAGCPRLTRDLPVERAEARQRLRLDPDARVALLATSPDRGHIELAEIFCQTLENTCNLVGVVRLHPAESISVYAKVVERHPTLRFIENSEATLDESIAAADVVVAKGSGVGSDALVKRRKVVILSPTGKLEGNDWELVNSAGCALATTSEELALILDRVLSDQTSDAEAIAASEKYVAEFCAHFGRDAAQVIADVAHHLADSSKMSPNECEGMLLPVDPKVRGYRSARAHLTRDQ